jgi:hypothetical protein
VPGVPRAAPAGDGQDNLDLFVGVILDQMADVDHTLVAGEALGSGVGGWCGKVVHGGLLSRLSGLRGASTPPGPLLYLKVFYYRSLQISTDMVEYFS